jgi:hypothetical protein
VAKTKSQIKYDLLMAKLSAIETTPTTTTDEKLNKIIEQNILVIELSSYLWSKGWLKSGQGK